MSEERKYPRIWDRSGERRIIGETRVSWLICAINERTRQEYEWAAPAKVPKKKINAGHSEMWPMWFWSEEDRQDAVYAPNHRWKIADTISRGNHDSTTLRKIAELIGYEANV